MIGVKSRRGKLLEGGKVRNLSRQPDRYYHFYSVIL